MKTSTKVALVVILILGVAVVAQAYMINRERLKVAAAVADKQAAVLETNGWKRAAVERGAELLKKVPALEAELAAAREVKAPVLIAGRTITERVPFNIPCGDRPPSPTAGAGESGMTSTAPPPAGNAAVDVSADVQTAVAGLADGRVEWASRVFATLRAGDWTETRELPVHESAVGVDPKLTAAWRNYVLGPPWSLELRALASSTPGIRLGASWFGRKHRLGFAFDYDRTWRDSASCSSYFETCQTTRVTGNEVAAGVAVRLGPR